MDVQKLLHQIIVALAILGLLFGSLLAYANGANDNFKGVATLFGSGTTNYRKALIWAGATTALGSIAAIFLANGLLEAFKGKGLVPPEVVSSANFGLSVALAAGLTVLLATRLGFPISTTHSLIGALVGAGLLASNSGVYFDKLGSNFVLPLIASPIIAVLAAISLYPLFRTVRRKLKIRRDLCLCVGTKVVAANVTEESAAALMLQPDSLGLSATIATTAECREAYTGTVAGVSAESLVNGAHFLSSGAVSFARGLNDTPKIAALMLVGGTISPTFAIAAVAAFMLAGGLFSAKKVGETMALKVTRMNHSQGLTANLVTSTLVIFASKLGFPVSTTHVSCGALFGIGTITRQAHWHTILGILAAWVITLPVAALLAGLTFSLLESI